MRSHFAYSELAACGGHKNTEKERTIVKKTHFGKRMISSLGRERQKGLVFLYRVGGKSGSSKLHAGWRTSSNGQGNLSVAKPEHPGFWEKGLGNVKKQFGVTPNRKYVQHYAAKG